MKTYILLFSIILFSCTTSKNLTHDSLECTITKIDSLDDGQPIIYVTNNSISAIVISQNTTNLGKSISKIQVGKKYTLKLKKIERNFRGQNDAYGIQSSKGKEKIVWRKEDGIPLLLYESYNLSGLILHHTNKQ